MQRFEQIYAEHAEAVRAYVRRRAPEAIVDDVVSDTFLVCLRKIDRVPAEPLPWLYAVARKTLANERRKRARVVHGHEVPADEPAPVGDGALAAAFNALSERDREVLRLVAWEGLSPPMRRLCSVARRSRAAFATTVRSRGSRRGSPPLRPFNRNPKE